MEEEVLYRVGSGRFLVPGTLGLMVGCGGGGGWC